jgi:citronellyl-CoA synthetase
VEVPKADGRAGMAALTLAEGVKELDLENFSEYINRELPPYARPVLLRVLTEMDTTGTFKLVKGDLRKQGYDLDQIADAVYVMKPDKDTYEPLDKAFARRIRDGKAGY